MENRSTSSVLMSSEPIEQTGKCVANANMNSIPLPPQQSRNLSQGHLAILWDIENCSVPSDVRPEDVAGNIRMALRVHHVTRGAVTMFSAYGDFNSFPRRLREGCQRTGVKLIDVPNGRKDAADKAILVDMFLFALDNPPPSSIMLISGDVDFAPALHILGQRGYTVILVIPSGVGVSSALCNAGNFVWDWPSVARGEGFLPPAKTSTHFHGNPKDLPSYFLGCHINDNADGQNEEEAIVYRGISQKFHDTLDFSMVSESLTEYNSTSVSIPSCPMTSRSRSPPSVINEVSDGNLAPCDQNNSIWVQPGDLNVLKGQLVKLLELSGGCLSLTRVPTKYQKIYGRPLYISEYGALELVDLLKKKKMSDSLGLSVKGEKRYVYLRNSRGAQKSSSFVLLKKERKGKGAREDNTKIMAGTGSSEDCSDEERVVIEQNERTGDKSASRMEAHSPCDQNNSIWVQPGDLNGLKDQLVKLLQLSGGCLSLTRIPTEYQKIFGRPLCISEYGALELVDLLKKKKMSDSLGLRVKGEKRYVYLRNSRGAQKPPSSVLLKKERKGDNTEIMAGTGSSEDCSDGERVVIRVVLEQNDRTGKKSASQMKAHSPCDQNNSIWVQPRDLNDLKDQLVKLLQLSGGCLSLTRVPTEYQKIYGRPLYISEYGALELVDLLKKKMSDSLGLRVKGEKRYVYLRNSRGTQKLPSFVLLKKKRKGRKGRKGKGAQEDNTESMAGTGSSEDCSDEERVVIEQNERTKEKSASQMEAHSQMI